MLNDPQWEMEFAARFRRCVDSITRAYPPAFSGIQTGIPSRESCSTPSHTTVRFVHAVPFHCLYSMFC